MRVAAFRKAKNIANLGLIFRRLLHLRLGILEHLRRYGRVLCTWSDSNASHRSFSLFLGTAEASKATPSGSQECANEQIINLIGELDKHQMQPCVSPYICI